MSDVERAITELVRETVEAEVDIPSEDDIERMIKDEVQERLERELSDCLDSEEVTRSADLEALKVELLHAIEVRTIGHKAGALKEQFKNKLRKIFTGRVKNGRTVQLWTLLF